MDLSFANHLFAKLKSEMYQGIDVNCQKKTVGESRSLSGV